MFHSDDYELQTLQLGHCPYCRNKTEQTWYMTTCFMDKHCANTEAAMYSHTNDNRISNIMNIYIFI